jgi:hypothetical protein
MRHWKMKNTLAAAAMLGLIGSALYAGGPVVVAEEAVAVAEEPASSGSWVLPVILLAVIGLAITSGCDDRARVSTR